MLDIALEQMRLRIGEIESNLKAPVEGLGRSIAEFDDKFQINERVFNNFIEITKDKGINGSASEIETSKDWIHMRLKALIARQQWNDEGFYRAVNNDDRMIVKALDLFNEKTQN